MFFFSSLFCFSTRGATDAAAGAWVCDGGGEVMLGKGAVGIFGGVSWGLAVGERAQWVRWGRWRFCVVHQGSRFGYIFLLFGWFFLRFVVRNQGGFGLTKILCNR